MFKTQCLSCRWFKNFNFHVLKENSLNVIQFCRCDNLELRIKRIWNLIFEKPQKSSKGKSFCPINFLSTWNPFIHPHMLFIRHHAMLFM